MRLRSDNGAILRGIGLITLVCLVGFVLVGFAGATKGISQNFYAFIDFPGFLAVIVTAIILGLAMLNTGAARIATWQITPIPVPLIAFTTLVISLISTHLVYHGYAFSMDEWMTRMQGELFRAGQLAGVLPDEWRADGRALFHSFAAYDANTGRIASDYRPGMSMLWALFDLVGASLYVSAVMNAAAVLLVARVARQIWPSEPQAPVIAALLLATSQQALAASLTSYAMSAHLCFNLVWLTLFLEDRWRSHIMAAFVGVATAALHQIHMHLFFALPFLLGLLRPFRPGLVLMYGVVYLIGHLGIWGWDWLSINFAAEETAYKGRDLGNRVSAMAEPPGSWALSTVAANLVRMFAWQNLALLPLLMLSGRAIWQQRIPRLLLLSILVSTLPYPILMPDQGHGWGYRYLHGLLGHLALLAVPGWLWLMANSSTLPRFRGWIMACLVVGAMILLPFRGWQIERQVRPFWLGSNLLAAQNADVVIVESSLIYIGGDLPRNSAVQLERPVQIAEVRLTPNQISRICSDYDVVYIDKAQLEQLGLMPVHADYVPDTHAARLQVLQSAKCAD